jgi:Outer membrane protein beta-barrel domain
MARMVVFALVIIASLPLRAQQYSISFGVYSGVIGSFTSDQGIYKDPRYEARFEAKLAPIGLNIGVDYEDLGFMISPGLVHVGQNSYLVNTSGGQDGLREIDLKYLTVPFAFKVYLYRFSAFKLSAVASIAPAFLLDGKEELSHTDTKLTFPSEVYPILPSNYIVEYDGVLTPGVEHYSIAKKEDFRSMQLFAGAGFRTDWDPSNHWRISFDLRVNYGIFDPRSEAYKKNLMSDLSLYQIPGERRDMFAQFTVGISRYLEFDKDEQDRKKKVRGSSKKFTPSQYPGQRQWHSKPKD